LCTFQPFTSTIQLTLPLHDALPIYFTEVLSGDYYQEFSTSSPHQIWSAAMVVSPLLRGLFGLQTDAQNRQITLSPHVPADWTSRSEEHTSELQSRENLVCRLLLEKK